MLSISLSGKVNVWGHRFLLRWVFASAYLGLMLCWVPLPLRGQCYQAKSLSGFHDLYPPAIEARACALADLVQVPAGAPPFKTFGYDLYPVLAYANPERSYGSQFQRLVEKHNQEQDYYLLIVKEFGQDGNISRYRLALKLPAGAPYDTLNAFTRSAITGQLQQIADEASDYNPKTSYLVEGEIMDALGRILQGRNTLGDVMALAGFERIHLEESFQVEVTENLKTDGPRVYDFSGLRSGETMVRDLASSGIGGAGPDQPVLVLTADQGANLADKYRQAEQVMLTSGAKVVAWIHFAIPDTGSVQVLKKIQSNYTPEEAAAILEELYAAHMADYYAQVAAADILKDAEPPVNVLPNEPIRSASVNCANANCDFPSTATVLYETIFEKEQFFARVQAYSFYCCDLNPFTCNDIFSVIYPQFIGMPSPQSLECLQVEYSAGLAYGLLDGLKGTLAFGYDLIYITGKHIPGQPEFWADLARKVLKEGLVGGVKSKYREDVEFVYTLAKNLSQVYQHFGTIVKAIISELKDAVGNALFFNGPKAAGYTHGNLAFEALLTAVTAGYGTLAKAIAVRGLSVFRGLGDDILEVVKKGVKSVKFIDKVYDLQKKSVEQWKGNISVESTIRKGNFAEMASDVFLRLKGYKPLHVRITDINNPTHKGIDGVFNKGDKYLIIESKYKGTATLSMLADGTRQMSDSWLLSGAPQNRLFIALGRNREIYDENINLGYTRLLAEVSPDGIPIYKELNNLGYEIGEFIP